MTNGANTLIKHISSQVGGFCANFALYGFDTACYYAPSCFARRVVRADILEPETDKSTKKFRLSTTMNDIVKDFGALSIANAMMDDISTVIASQGYSLNRIQTSSLRSAIIGGWYRYYNGKDVMSITQILQDLMTGAERALFIGMSIQLLNQLLGDPTEEKMDPAVLALGGIMGECLLCVYNQISKRVQNKYSTTTHHAPTLRTPR